jgi:hypothetical protein
MSFVLDGKLRRNRAGTWTPRRCRLTGTDHGVAIDERPANVCGSGRFGSGMAATTEGVDLAGGVTGPDEGDDGDDGAEPSPTPAPTTADQRHLLF